MALRSPYLCAGLVKYTNVFSCRGNMPTSLKFPLRSNTRSSLLCSPDRLIMIIFILYIFQSWLWLLRTLNNEYKDYLRFLRCVILLQNSWYCGTCRSRRRPTFVGLVFVSIKCKGIEVIYKQAMLFSVPTGIQEYISDVSFLELIRHS